jgi:hypothetical protein
MKPDDNINTMYDPNNSTTYPKKNKTYNIQFTT